MVVLKGLQKLKLTFSMKKKENIFSNTYFGKLYELRNGDIAHFVSNMDEFYLLRIEGLDSVLAYTYTGQLVYPYNPDFDIVSEVTN